MLPCYEDVMFETPSILKHHWPAVDIPDAEPRPQPWWRRILPADASSTIPGYKVEGRLHKGEKNESILVVRNDRDGQQYIQKRIRADADRYGQATNELKALLLIGENVPNLN